MHSTNYFNTLIEVAEDCKVESGVMPPVKENKKTVANMQFEMLFDQPYLYTSDDALFKVHAARKGFEKEELDGEREHYFSKGQPCFRASPLTKSYGWGVHSDLEGKIAIYSMDSEEYKRLMTDTSIKKVRAMRSKRK